MKTRNRVFIGSGMILLLMLLAGIGLVSAYGPWGDSCPGFGPRFQDRRFFCGEHSRDRADFILWRMDKMAKELNLTSTQKAKYEVLKGNIEAHFTEARNDHQKMKDQFRTEMSKEDPNVKNLAETMKAKIIDLSGFLNQNLDLLVDFYESLDSGQKRLLNDEIRERMNIHQG
jgi:LTXXQ motif family protein